MIRYLYKNRGGNMIKFDFSTYVSKYIDNNEYNSLLTKKEEVINKFNSYDMIGWTDRISNELVHDIKETASYIKNNFDLLVMVGIGGSFLGSYAFSKMFSKYFNKSDFEIIYAGNNLSSKYMNELLDYLKDKNFCVCVISKSGTTLETTITYNLLKDLLNKKYSSSDIKNHIITITDKEKGKLREETNIEGYKSFVIPNNIGGRYSFITPAHLLPLAINYDIDQIINNYYDGKELLDEAYNYAVTRKLLFDKGKVVENYSVYEDNMSYFTEWLKQLFGESEGKDGVGILPMSTINPRDLHSLGQFIQDGNKIIFETFFKVQNSSEMVMYDNRNLHDINNIVLDSVVNAHYSGGVPCILINMDELSLENVSKLIYFYELSAVFSSILFGVNPFNQPGVEVYKKEVKDRLNV